MKGFIKTIYNNIYTIRIKKVFVGRRIKELERVYGIRDGSAGKVRTTNGQSNFTEEDLADKLVSTLKHYNVLKPLLLFPLKFNL